LLFFCQTKKLAAARVFRTDADVAHFLLMKSFAVVVVVDVVVEAEMFVFLQFLSIHIFMTDEFQSRFCVVFFV
jgi:hypothetical protein